MFHSSKFILEILFNWASKKGEILIVSHKGDAFRGLILIKQELTNHKVRFWIQETNADGIRVFKRRHGEDMAVDKAEGFIEREINRDQDLWVIAQENSTGCLPDVLNSLPLEKLL